MYHSRARGVHSPVYTVGTSKTPFWAPHRTLCQQPQSCLQVLSSGVSLPGDGLAAQQQCLHSRWLPDCLQFCDCESGIPSASLFFATPSARIGDGLSSSASVQSRQYTAVIIRCPPRAVRRPGAQLADALTCSSHAWTPSSKKKSQQTSPPQRSAPPLSVQISPPTSFLRTSCRFSILLSFSPLPSGTP